jgi:hypothetical protein
VAHDQCLFGQQVLATSPFNVNGKLVLLCYVFFVFVYSAWFWVLVSVLTLPEKGPRKGNGSWKQQLPAKVHFCTVYKHCRTGTNKGTHKQKTDTGVALMLHGCCAPACCEVFRELFGLTSQ